MVVTKLPSYVNEILHRLEESGFEAYVVGGCVRDHLLSLIPTDYDITTSATPPEIKAVFPEIKTVDIGIAHGTVGLCFENAIVEVTTFRIDGEYQDSRHPTEVVFTPSLEEDLKRRDFTVNAMAFSPSRGLVDLFGGVEDLKKRIIRCVGNPQMRFTEDALRIMRALRFASTLGFTIEEGTLNAARSLRTGLLQVASERITTELVKMLCGANIKQVLMETVGVLGAIIPELLPMENFDQRNPHHIYNVLEHTAVALENVEPTSELRLAVLFHDIGKPSTFTLDESGVGHFHGHAEASVDLTKAALQRFRLDKATFERVLQLVRWHDYWIEPNKKSVKRMLNRLTPEGLDALLKVKCADNIAQHPEHRDRLKVYEKIREISKEIITDEECFSLKDLAVNGKDLMGIGIPPGPHIGEVLNHLLDEVVEERIPNERKTLLDFASTLK